jgi:hypothetical protein
MSDATSLRPRSGEPTSPGADGDESLLGSLLQAARVEDTASIAQLLSLAGIKASDLTAVDDHHAEAMLQKAGLLVGDCIKIVQAIGGFRNSRGPSRGAPKASRGCGCGLCGSAQPCLCGAAARAPLKPSMRCGLIMYSTTVLIVTLTVRRHVARSAVCAACASTLPRPACAAGAVRGVCARMVASPCSGRHAQLAASTRLFFPSVR